MLNDRKFTVEDLRRCDGETEPMCIAHNGIVYDVSQSRRWKNGLHENLHFPGQDLTFELEQAPHGEEVFNHPNITVIGFLEISNNTPEK